MNSENFLYRIIPLEPYDIGGDKYDYLVRVQRKSDGKKFEEMVSGGMEIADAMVRKLMRKLDEVEAVEEDNGGDEEIDSPGEICPTCVGEGIDERGDVCYTCGGTGEINENIEEVKESDLVKVDMSVVKRRDSFPPYIRLVEQAIKNAKNNTPYVAYVPKNNMVYIRSWELDHMGDVVVPIEAVTVVKPKNIEEGKCKPRKKKIKEGDMDEYNLAYDIVTRIRRDASMEDLDLSSAQMQAVKRNWSKIRYDKEKSEEELVKDMVAYLNEDIATTVTGDVATHPERLGKVQKRKKKVKPEEYFNGLPVFEVSMGELMSCARSRRSGSRFHITTETVKQYLRETGYRKSFYIRCGDNYFRLK